MRIDFSEFPDPPSYVSVPPGEHVSRVAEVREGRARSGAVRWTFRLEVVGGPHAGLTACWDSITFDAAGARRAENVLDALGFDTSEVLDIEARDLVDMRALVTLEPEPREDPLSGRVSTHNRARAYRSQKGAPHA